jgi:F-type H+-transporting ATPase subunit gamma
MATLREVRNRISGIKKTQKITRAMKMVAAAKLRRAQMNVIAARPYAAKMKELLVHLAAQAQDQLRSRPQDGTGSLGSAEDGAGPGSLLVPREGGKRSLLMVVTSDRGFCGAFNSNVIRAAVEHINKQMATPSGPEPVGLACVGKKGIDFFSKRPQYTIREKRLGIFNQLVYAEAQSLARSLVAGYLAGEYDRVEIIYNEFKNVAQQRIVVEQFLPVPAEVAKEEEKKGKHHQATDYIYEPSPEKILGALVPKYLDFQVWRVLLESYAAETGARMAAMENATENASELILSLQLAYNKARQAAITKELLEVVSGAEALTQAG